MNSHSASKGGERRDPAISAQTSALCGAGERYARWLREVEDELRRGCAVVTRGAGAVPSVEVLIHLDAHDDTPSAAMWSGVRFLADRLAARYGLRVAPIRLADAVLFRITARPAAAVPVERGQGGGWLGAWLRRRARAASPARRED